MEIKYLADSTKCIDVPGADMKNGNTLWLWDCNGEKQQQWKGGGAYQWMNQKDPSKCLVSALSPHLAYPHLAGNSRFPVE
jgi:hypothetical protein